jgi:hypothetical protein
MTTQVNGVADMGGGPMQKLASAESETEAARGILAIASRLTESDSPLVRDTAVMVESLAYNLLRHLGDIGTSVPPGVDRTS